MKDNIRYFVENKEVVRIYQKWMMEWGARNDCEVHISYAENHLTYLADIIKEVYKLSPLYKGVILDIGCGCGISTLMLSYVFPYSKVIGIDKDDYSHYYLQLREIFREIIDNTTQNSIFVVEDAKHYTNKNNKESLMICIFNGEGALLYEYFSYLKNKDVKWNKIFFDFESRLVRSINLILPPYRHKQTILLNEKRTMYYLKKDHHY